MHHSDPIGVFDSGIGGLTVAHALTKMLPNESIFYFGDTAHFPYGDKSTPAIQAYAIKICNVLLSQHCKAILIACNSASAAAYDLVKEYVGSRAIVMNVIDPMVAHVAQEYADKKVGLIGTKQTVGSNVYQVRVDSLNKGVQLRSLATPLLAPMVEEGFFNDNISHHVISEYLGDEVLEGIEGLILGCTHYPLLKKEISDYYQNSVDVIDGSVTVAMAMKNKLDASGLLSTQTKVKHRFYVSDYTPSFHKSSKIFFGEEVDLQPYTLWE